MRSGRDATSSLTPPTPTGPDSPHLQQCSPRMLPVTRTQLVECRDPARLSTAVVAQSPGSPVPLTPTHSRGGASLQRPGTAIFRAVGKGGRRDCFFDSVNKIQRPSSQALVGSRTDSFVATSSLPHLTHGKGKLGQLLLSLTLGKHLCSAPN